MKKIRLSVLAACFISILIAGCARNEPWRTTTAPQDCDDNPDACATAIWERHTGYKLAFIEFTERGNVFSNEHAQTVYDRLWDLSKKPQPLAIMVFVHGWKHNANTKDGNVISFRHALKNLGESGVLGPRQLVGVYIGWRGLSVHGLGSENLSYWDRKAVAQEVGKGGVSEVFIELEKIDRSNSRNYLFIVGHSFGGAITLSALNEIFLERLKTAHGNADVPLRAFGEGTVIINPAIEANQILQLKESSMALGGADPYQPNLLHVLSSKGDSATHTVFPIGQALGVGLTWNQHNLQRKYKSKNYLLSEYDLDTTTVGNYIPFHTAALLDLEGIREPESQKLFKKFKVVLDRKAMPTLGQWIIHSYCSNPQVSEAGQTEYFPCEDNEAVSFIYTTESFIKDHNDVFNDNVMAYFSTLVSEAIFKQDQTRYFPRCAQDGRFLFESCFNYHRERYKGLKDAF
ncbi:hypothetical protein [uncultured Desulfosarcina sp.]|uniref:hypothetical protein n=1 Tax=uncultured Desulfosarcina sp. TaxID=218289 RepID=UPI0029C85E11|nr:hypothetical protein [uncultured Desulfosarcina sp.]